MGYAITLTIGIIILIISLFLLKKSIAFIRNGEHAIATVIELKENKDSDGTTYYPIFKFTTANNEEIIYKYNASTSPPSWSIGEHATIAYDSNNPKRAKLLTYFGAFIWTVVLMAIAMPLIVIGGGYYIAQSFLKELLLH